MYFDMSSVQLILFSLAVLPSICFGRERIGTGALNLAQVQYVEAHSADLPLILYRFFLCFL